MTWASATLGEVTTILSGTTPESTNPAYWNVGAHVWITPTDLGKLGSWEIRSSARTITDAALAKFNLPRVPSGSVVMSSRAPIGHLAIARCDLHTNQGCKSFVCSEHLDSEFLFLTLRHRMPEIQDLGSGATFVEVSKSALAGFEISYPNILEQRRIAAHLKAQLAAVEQARQAAQAQLRDAKRLVQATLAAAFAQTADAEFVRLGDITRTTSGSTPSRSRKEYWQPPMHPWVKTGEVVFAPIRVTEECISERALAECSLSLLPAGTVLIAMYGQGKTRGQSAVLEVPATTNQACFAILPCDALHPEYLQFWLRYSYEALRTLSEARGGNQSNLNGEILNAFEVPLIPREQQEALAKEIKSSLAVGEQLRIAVEMQLADIEQLPARLLAQAFNPTDEGTSP